MSFDPPASNALSGTEEAEGQRLLSILLSSVAAVGAFGAILALASQWSFASYLFSQDLLVLSGLSVILIFIKLRGPDPVCGDALVWALGRRWTPGLLVLMTLVVARIGVKVVFMGTPVSGDEARADFDSMVFAAGNLAANVPEALRFVIEPMRAIYFLDIPGDAAWVSSYLPGNGLLRALFRLTLGPSWCGPVLAGLAVLACYGVARQLWPERRDVAVLAALLLATTPQVLVTAMTPFAMTAHLACNLCWLWLFLKNKASSHAAALLVGFVGTGLHQYIFHPLFVLPFGILLLIQRRWLLGGVYATFYAAFILFWMSYHGWLIAAYGVGAPPLPLAGSVSGWWSQVVDGSLGHNQLATQAVLNLARLVAWSSPAALLLLPAGFATLRRGRPIELAMAAGLALTMLTSMVVIPFQGNGWGYRYAHGVLGSLVLLSAGGFVALTSRRIAAHLQATVATLTLAGVLVLGPLDAILAARHARPIVASLNAIETAKSDLVVVDDAKLPFGMDLVRNRPDLSNTPWVLLLSRLNQEVMEKLCPGKTVAVFDAQVGERLGLSTTALSRPEMIARREMLEMICHPIKIGVSDGR